jgi:hypothetical protein
MLVERHYSRRDVWLGVAAGYGLLVSLARSAEGNLDAVFWGSVLATAGAVLLARDKRTPICGALLFLALRFAFAFAVSFRPLALVGAVVTGAICLIFAWPNRQH